MKKKTADHMIKQAIDSYPGGICFSAPNGRIILANKKINDLVLELTDHTILNAETVWEELSRIPVSSKPGKLDEPWLPKKDSINHEHACKQLFFLFSDDSVWRFDYAYLDEAIIQIEAADITKLYQLSQELYENSIRLREMQERQRVLLQNIVQINQNKEILAAKLRIHDEFGQCLLATNKALSEHNLAEHADTLRKNWDNSIHHFLNLSENNAQTNASLQNELMQVAELIGCKIIFKGTLPTDSATSHLLYAAVREALTNAVRHANATKLTVAIDKTSSEYHIEISDNGEPVASAITEGTGLSTLRERLKQNGAALSIHCNQHVILCIDIPCTMN